MAEYAFKDVITAKDIMTQEISVIDLLGRERKGWFLNSMPEYIDANTLYRLHSPRRLVDVNPFSMTPFKDDRGDCYCLFISEKEPEKRYVPFDLRDPEQIGMLYFCWLIHKDSGDYYSVTAIHPNDNLIHIDDYGDISPQELLERFKFYQDMPCGRLVEE